MKIRRSTPEDIDILMQAYDCAKELMQRTGNKNQWNDGYPSREVIMQDIADGHSFVCLADDGEIAATFFFRVGEDPTYARIDNGRWLNDAPYGVVHRIASLGRVKGVAGYCLQWCFGQCGNMRIDTHEENKIMQHILRKYGYQECGIIYVRNGMPRVAFQKIR